MDLHLGAALAWLTALPLAGVVVGYAVKTIEGVWTRRTQRHHERDIRFLDTATRAAVDFLAAAEWATRAQQAALTAGIALQR